MLHKAVNRVCDKSSGHQRRMSPAIVAVGSLLLRLLLLLKCQEGIQGDQAVRGHGES